jgi:hypothetical protein
LYELTCFTRRNLMQTTSNLLMIRPVNFRFNEQTAANNMFQQNSDDADIQLKALKEFDGFVSKLINEDLNVTVIDDTLSPETPDSIFPNNWVSFHEDGTVIRYPMFSPNRRLERREEILAQLNEHFVIGKQIDLSPYENNNLFLEGTGSLVLDRVARIAYACRSVRTDERVITDFCKQMDYSSIVFDAIDSTGFPVYHTNVMMCVASQYAVICLDAIPDPTEKNKVIASLKASGKEIISITMDQMNRYAGNMLQVTNKEGKLLIIMSVQAYKSLSSEQLSQIMNYNEIITAPIDTIEKLGGGSARCMLAEIHLKER